MSCEILRLRRAATCEELTRIFDEPSRRTLVVWDVDDTLVATHPTRGPRQLPLFSEAECIELFATKRQSGCEVAHVLLSLGTVEDVFPLFRPYAQRVGGGSLSRRKDFLCHLRATWGADSSIALLLHDAALFGISMSTISSATTLSTDSIFVDGSTLSKLDVVWSLAHNSFCFDCLANSLPTCMCGALWDRVVFVDNSLMELGLVEPGLPPHFYTAASADTLAEQLFSNTFLQYKSITETAHVAQHTARIELVHFRIPSGRTNPPRGHHKIFPGEFGCDDATFDRLWTAMIIHHSTVQCSEVYRKFGLANAAVLSRFSQRCTGPSNTASGERRDRSALWLDVTERTTAFCDAVCRFSSDAAALASLGLAGDDSGASDRRHKLRQLCRQLLQQRLAGHHAISNGFLCPALHGCLARALHEVAFATPGGQDIPSALLTELFRQCTAVIVNNPQCLTSRRWLQPDVDALVTSSWDCITRVWKPEDGSNVFFVETKRAATGDVMTQVVKGSMFVVQELFANMVFVACDLFPSNAVPKCRLIAWPSEEWDTLKASVNASISSDKTSQEGLRRSVAHMMDRSVLLVQEYISHPLHLTDVGRLFSTIADDLNMVPIVLDFMLQLGSVLAVDAFLNNSDRLPLMSLWANDGNTANILASWDHASRRMVIHPVDNLFVPLHASRHKHYVLKLVAVVKTLSDTMKSVAAFLVSQCGFPEFGEDAARALERGFVQAAEKICALFADTGKAFDQAAAALTSLVITDWESYWTESVSQFSQAGSLMLSSVVAAMSHILSDTGKSHIDCEWRELYSSWKLISKPDGSAIAPDDLLGVAVVSDVCTAQRVTEALEAFQRQNKSGLYPHVVIFPECACSASSIMDLISVSRAAPHTVICCGTFSQSLRLCEGTFASSQRCVVLMNGSVLHTYDKQFLDDGIVVSSDGKYSHCFTVDFSLASGIRTVCFAVAVCRDVEDRGIRQQIFDEAEALCSKSASESTAVIVLNPVFIPLPTENTSVSSQLAALGCSARRLERVAVSEAEKTGRAVYLVRCDAPVVHGGSGASQIISHEVTFQPITVSDPTAHNVTIRLSTSGPNKYVSAVRTVHRTDPDDDIGKRLVLRTVSVAHLLSDADNATIDCRWQNNQAWWVLYVFSVSSRQLLAALDVRLLRKLYTAKTSCFVSCHGVLVFPDADAKMARLAYVDPGRPDRLFEVGHIAIDSFGTSPVELDAAVEASELCRGCCSGESSQNFSTRDMPINFPVSEIFLKKRESSRACAFMGAGHISLALPEDGRHSVSFAELFSTQ